MTLIRFVPIVGLEKMLNKLLFWRVVLLLLSMGFFNGCCMLPAGEPPAGEIIQVAVNKEVASESEAHEYLATSLMSYLLTENINNFSISCDDELAVICNKFVGLINFSKTTANKADLLLKIAAKDETGLSVLLEERATQKNLWQDGVKINKN